MNLLCEACNLVHELKIIIIILGIKYSALFLWNRENEKEMWEGNYLQLES